MTIRNRKARAGAMALRRRILKLFERHAHPGVRLTVAQIQKRLGGVPAITVKRHLAWLRAAGYLSHTGSFKRMPDAIIVVPMNAVDPDLPDELALLVPAERVDEMRALLGAVRRQTDAGNFEVAAEYQKAASRVLALSASPDGPTFH